MSSDTTVCPHCKGQREPGLAPGNFLCLACVEQATDAQGWPVSMATDLDADGLPTEIIAIHGDWTRCMDVGNRHRAYVDDTAFLVLTGEPGQAFLQPLAVPEPPGIETRPGPEDMEKYWELVHVAFNVDVQELKDGDTIYIDYETGKPYRVHGQLRPINNGFHIEMVSNEFLPADDWPLEVEYLEDYGWSPPNKSNPNWHMFVTESSLATAMLLGGLRWGRACEDPFELGWISDRVSGPTAGSPPG